MKNFKVKKKLIISFGIVLAMFVISVISVTISLQLIKSQLQQFYNVPWQTRGAAQELMTNLAEEQKSLFRAIATTDDSIITPALEDVESYGKKIEENISLIESKALQQNVGIVNDLKDKIAQWDKVKETVTTMAADTSISSNDISDYIEKNGKEVINGLNESLKSTVEKTNETGEQMISDTNMKQVVTTVILLVMCIASIIIGVLLCLYITREITVPLKELELAADQMAEGNLNVTINYKSEMNWEMLPTV